MPVPLDHALVGKKVSFSKTVSESDVYLFAGVTGDLSPNHVDEVYMRQTAYGQRIAHGALLVGFMSTTSTAMAVDIDVPSVSYGYDRIRFLAPVFFGDTVTVHYEITAFEPAQARTLARVEVLNQRKQTVAAATHILKFFPGPAPEASEGG